MENFAQKKALMFKLLKTSENFQKNKTKLIYFWKLYGNEMQSNYEKNLFEYLEMHGQESLLCTQYVGNKEITF